MGYHARIYTLEHFGVDIGDDNEEKPPAPKKDWKWSCKLCNKPLGSYRAHMDHMKAKHNE